MQPQRDSNPCRHLERAAGHVHSVSWNRYVPGHRAPSSADISSVHPISLKGWTNGFGQECQSLAEAGTTGTFVVRSRVGLLDCRREGGSFGMKKSHLLVGSHDLILPSVRGRSSFPAPDRRFMTTQPDVTEEERRHKSVEVTLRSPAGHSHQFRFEPDGLGRVGGGDCDRLLRRTPRRLRPATSSSSSSGSASRRPSRTRPSLAQSDVYVSGLRHQCASRASATGSPSCAVQRWRLIGRNVAGTRGNRPRPGASTPARKHGLRLS